MRGAILVLVLLGACGGGSSPMISDAPPACPTVLSEGDLCSFAGTCFHDDQLSSCRSGTCTCEAGRVHCTPISPNTGDSCADAPVTQCTYEGNQGCTIGPTSEACSCDGQTWHCECACYGGQSTCGGLCDAPPSVLNGKACGEEHGSCSFPGGVICRCESAGPGAPPTFTCN